MYRFATTFARTLALFTLTSLVGCDDLEDVDIDELDADEIELRNGAAGGAGGLPIAGIPYDHHGVDVAFGVPMQPTVAFKSKLTFGLHGPTNLAYTWTPDPAGAPHTILVDANGLSPYSGELAPVDESVCESFLELHPHDVPVTSSVAACAEIEHGCCDYICYQWGGYPKEEDGHNKVGPVTNETFKLAELYGKEMIWGTFVEPVPPDEPRMTWDMDLPNGGHSTRETVCQCDCTFDL